MDENDDTIRKEFIKCSKLVPIPKLLDEDSKKYWNEVFEKLDRDTRVPPYRRLQVLEKTFEKNVLEKILNILKIDFAEDFALDDTASLDSTNIPFRRSLQYSVCVPRESLPKIDFRTHLTKQKTSNRKRDALMYIEFLNQPEETVAKWRSRPPVTFKGMNLSEKCEAITVAIATNFVEWLESLGGDDVTLLDVNVILKLFEIGFTAHAADSLCVAVRELIAVTKSIAEARRMPEASFTAQLYKQLNHDVYTISKQEKTHAFGTMLPVEMRKAPQSDNAATKWVQNKRVPEDISSMAVIWRGIEHLKTTKGYCKWLQGHPDIEPPKYLVESGLMGNYISHDGLDRPGVGSYTSDSVHDL